MSFTVSLASPGSDDYDLYVYYNTASNVLECNTIVGFSENGPGVVDEVSSSFGEPVVSNGVDDKSIITVEIFALSAACVPSADWTLTITGDTS